MNSSAANLRQPTKNRLLLEMVCLLTVALIPAAGAAFWHPKRPAWLRPTRSTRPFDVVDVFQAQGWGQRVLWLDARSPSEYEAGHIPGALALSESQWPQQVQAVMTARRPEMVVVVYGAAESMDTEQRLADRLRNETGWNGVYVLRGGWDAWQQITP